MKKILILLSLLQVIHASAQGYEIKITLKPYKNKYIYLGHYFGNSYPIIDSAKLDDNSVAVFRGIKKLQGGTYLIGLPNRSGFFEVLVDKQQNFAVIADTATFRDNVQFINSPDNEMLKSYQHYVNGKGKEINETQAKLRTASKKDSAELIAKLKKLDKDILDFRNKMVKDNPDAMLSMYLQAMREPVIPEELDNPKTKDDSLKAFNYYKSHYWDGVNFWDGRLAYTSFFEQKLDKYYQDVVAYHPDSVIKEIDAMLGPASINDEMTRFLLVKFVNRYLNMKYMWEDAVFVHLFEKYFAQKDYPWLTKEGRKTVTDRAYSLMANLMGTPAADIELKDSTGKVSPLYEVKAPYTVVAFWDPTCGHCKEMLPKLDSFYRAKWKNMGIMIYAVAKETDGTKKDWLDFINQQRLSGWVHVYYSKAEDNARIAANIPGYSQLFDVRTYPTLYLLDKNKNIIAKKLTYSQIDDVIELKEKGK
jgi:thiol-disulfide isomerase/thioredoxin